MLNSIKAIADEISQIADDDEDDYLLYDRKLTTNQSNPERSGISKKKKKDNKLNKSKVQDSMFSTTSAYERLFLKKKRIDEQLNKARKEKELDLTF